MSNIEKDEFVKSQIIEASKEVFKKYGYKKTNMKLIATASDKGRSTLYYYFKNKEDVFEAIILDLTKPLFDSYTTLIIKENSIDENLKIFTEQHIKHVDSLFESYNVLVKELKFGFDFTNKIGAKVRNNSIKIIKNCMRWAIDKAEIKTLSTTEIDFLSLAIVTSNENIVKEYYIYETIQGDITSRIKWINQLIIESLKIN